MNKNYKMIIVLASALLYLFSVLFMETYADPVGASVTNVTTVSGSTNPDSRSDDGGTITILTVSAAQQNAAWKAYVGNMSGSLTLDDANGRTIYDWSIAVGSLSGELYASVNSSVTWSGIECANGTTINDEYTILDMGVNDSDNINRTFNFTKHPTYVIAGATVTNSTCRSLYTYYNQSAQINNESSRFSEIIIQNINGDLVYVTQLENDEVSYGNDTITYDFQMLVPDNDLAGNITTYYFYAELDS